MGPLDNARETAKPSRHRYLIVVVLLAATYAGIAKLGLSFNAVSGFATLVWPPTGISLAALLVLGYRVWPGIALGAFVANFWVGAPVPVALGICVGNTLEALIGAWALQCVPGFNRSLLRVTDVLALIFLAALGSTLVSSTCGVVSLNAAGLASGNRFETWQAWWVGDAIGNLVVAPFILTWAERSKIKYVRQRLLEAGVLGATLVLLSLFIFGAAVTDDGAPLRQAYTVFPPLIWAASRFGTRGAASATLFVSTIAIWQTAQGNGPFGSTFAGNNLLVLQTFMAIVAITGLILGATISERNLAQTEARERQRQLREAHEELEHRVVQRTEALERTNASLKQEMAERRSAQEALVSRETQLAEAQAIARIGSWEWDLRNNRMAWSEEMHRIFGTSEAQFRASYDEFLSLIHPADRQCFTQALEGAYRELNGFSIEHKVARPDGEIRVVHARGRLVLDSAGRATHILGTSQDITERKAAEEQLSIGEERLRLLIEGVKDYAICLLDPAGHIVSWAAGAERIKGYRAEEVLGKHFSMFYAEEDQRANKPQQELANAVAQGSVEDEGWRIRKDGTRYWANVVTSAIFDDHGQLKGFAKVTRDLTERIQAEQERVRLAQAEEAVRLRDEFLSIASHELRTPLTSLHLQLQSLMDRASLLDEWALKKVQRSARSAERLAALVETLMDVSRLTIGQLTLRQETFDLHASARDVAERLAEQATKARCELKVSGESVVGDWDRLRVEQVITNLLSNALKYAGGTVIEVETRHENGRALLSVRDRGPGILPQDVDRIFRRFERAASIRHFGGLGLGLYISRQVIEAHGGSIDVSSAPGQGATFTVSLPV